MKNAKRIASLICVITICFSLISSLNFKSYADPALTISQIATAAFAYGQASGINWTISNANSGGVKTWMENKINSWLAGRTITEVFGSAVLHDVGGKLIIPATIATKIGDFLQALVEDEGLQVDNPTIINQGDFEGTQLATTSYNLNDEIIGVGIELYCVLPDTVPIYPNKISGNASPAYVYYNGVKVNNDGFSNRSSGRGYYSWNGWNLTSVDGKIRVNYFSTNWSADQTQETPVTRYLDVTVQESVNNVISGSLNDDYGLPEFPDLGYNWEGTIDGSTPDTNLDQLLGLIDNGIDNNDLIIDGDVVDPGPAPTPVPTPVPIEPDTPLQDVPWEGLNDLIGNVGTGIEDQIHSQTESITNAQEATTEAVESLTDTITEALDVPDEEELDDFKFDLRYFFPFCIPFDIYRLLTVFDAEPIAPHVQIPFVIESLNFSYNIDLDFSVFNPVAQILRTVEFIVYALGLAWATGKVIKW